jgi:hypothetical protein
MSGLGWILTTYDNLPPVLPRGARYFLRVHESRQGRVEVTASSGGGPAPSGWWRPALRRLLTVTAIAAALFGLFWCYLLQSRTTGADSDAADMVLQGWDMVQHGNLLLRGWVMADVSFYTFEIPLDGLVSAVYGLRTDVIHVAAAIEYALLVLFAALVAAGAASDRRLGGREAWVRGLIAAGIMVAPGTWQGSAVLLAGPDHTAVGVPVLITLLVVDRVVPRRWWPATATLLLTFVLLVWAQLDDLVATLSCAVPLALVCGASAAAFLLAAGVRRFVGVGRRRRDGRAPRARAARGDAQSAAYNAALAVLAAASFGVTELLIKAINNAGGFYSRAIPANSQISHWATVPAQLQALGENLLILYGANFWRLPEPQAAFAYLHLVCLALALLGLLVTIARWRQADRVARSLVVGIVVMLAAGAASPLMIPSGGTHEIAVVLPLGAALGGRAVGPWLADLAGSGQVGQAGRATRAWVTGLLAAAGLGLLCCLGYAAAQPAVPPKDAGLANWLVEHHLTSGLSGYWNANITTLITGGRVHLAPVTNGGKYGYLWVAKEAWFNPAVSHANFIVATTHQEGGNDVPLKYVLSWYGKPAKSYRFDQYTILVYQRNVLESVIQPVPSDLYAPRSVHSEGRATGADPSFPRR